MVSILRFFRVWSGRSFRTSPSLGMGLSCQSPSQGSGARTPRQFRMHSARPCSPSDIPFGGSFREISSSTKSYVERYWSDRITFYLNEIRSRYPDVFSKRVFFQRLGKSQNEAVQHVASLLTRAMPTRVLITEFDAFGSVLSKYRSAVDKAVAAILPRK